MPMPPELRERVRGWGKRSGVVLILLDGRVIGSLAVEDANREIAHKLGRAGVEYDDLWFKVFPVGEIAEREAEYRARYRLDRRTSQRLREILGDGSSLRLTKN